MNELTPIDAPALLPLADSWEINQLETDLKTVFLKVFESMIRPRERQLNLYGMPHLGGTDLIARALKDYGVAAVARDDVQTSFLLMAAKARNPRRGMIFLRQYLQSVWPNVWLVQPLWHPIATADQYPTGKTPLLNMDLGSGITVEYPANDGTAPNVYRTDWQGKVLLASVPRTNLFPNSSVDTNTPGAWALGENLTRIGNVVGPDGVNPATVYECVTPGDAYIEQTMTLQQGQTYTMSVWAKVVAGVPISGGIININNVYALPMAGSGIDGEWQRFSLTFTANDPRTFGNNVSVYITNDYGSGAQVAVADAQISVGEFAGSYIPTTTGPVTVTDFTLSADGIASFPGDLPPPKPIEYFRTSRIRVTLPVSSDNGLGLLEIAKAFRSTLAARLMLELQLSTVFENVGADGGLGLANGASGVMPVSLTGTFI